MRSEKGFTLIELLVVVAIIGILAAIAIPQFAEYKTRAFNSRAQSDLRNGLTGQEAAFVDNENYLDCSNAGCETSLPGFVLSDSVSVSFNAQGAADEEFGVASCHARGSILYTWKSSGSNANIIQTSTITSCSNPAAPTI